MSANRDISQVMRDTQERIFRIAQSQGLTLKAISLDSGIPYSTLRTYAGGTERATAEMPASALHRLVGVVPDELLSLMLPDGRAIVAVPEDINHDEFEQMCRDYLAAKAKAHRADSPGGREIAACERSHLDGHAVRLRVAA
jgi:hypothetical protein